MNTPPSKLAALPPVPPSPGVGARRKGPKSLPRLPASAFSPPNTGTSEKFPLAPSPSVVRPAAVVDAQASATALPDALGEAPLTGVVVSLKGKTDEQVAAAIESIRDQPRTPPVLAVLVPFALEAGVPATPPSYLTQPPPSPSTPSAPTPGVPRVVLQTVYTRYSAPAVDALRWALEHGFTVDVDIETNLRAGEGAWEDLEELLTKARPADGKAQGTIILSNILPPPDDISLPIVKLLTHPTYNEYQSQVAALSLYANIFVKFLPPAWPAGEGVVVDPREWKRRIKMYVGPALEAFGYERIIFGSSPASSSTSPSALSAQDWYELARESFAELGTEQEDLDAVFAGNARAVYGVPAAARAS